LSSLSTFLEAGVVLCNTAAAGAGDFGEVIPPKRKVVLSCLATNRGEKEKRPQIQTPAQQHSSIINHASASFATSRT
jgi:hypothetical protein